MKIKRLFGSLSNVKFPGHFCDPKETNFKMFQTPGTAEDGWIYIPH